ncbi:MAG: acyl-CoA desaturase [Myxococcales bacterium]|nr:acyl-CoA desaturase [Myxococcales bacterium]
MSSHDQRQGWNYGAPFYLMQGIGLAGLFVFPFDGTAALLVFLTYTVRMFGITAGFHRYFSHRGFKTGRIFQFILAFLGSATAQRGVIWWSGHHMDHHRLSDTDKDVHSPKKGLMWAHMLWMLAPENHGTEDKRIRAWRHSPEIIWIDRNWIVAPVTLAVGLLLSGGLAWVYWGFFFSTLLTWHGTFSINSLAHIWGQRRYKTKDTSRNNFWLALITLGEGWHNNHHHYASTANNGFFWWEVDISYMVLRVLAFFGVVWDLRTPPRWVLEGKRRRSDRTPTALLKPPVATPEGQSLPAHTPASVVVES